MAPTSEDEIKIPSEHATDKSERVHARRERIRKRVEYNETGTAQHLVKNQGPPLAWGCLEKTAEELYRLEVESEEMITNVRTANEAKEVMRRKQDQEDRNRRLVWSKQFK